LDEELIRRISEQVMLRLGQEKKDGNKTLNTREKPVTQSNRTVSTGSVIILLCGGTRELPEVFRQMEIIARSARNVFVVMTRSATSLIGIPEARRASQGGKIITELSQDYMENVLMRVDRIYIPVLSLNTAAKIVALNADTLGTITVVFGLLYGKQVIAAKNSVYCCQFEPESIPAPIKNRIDGIIRQLEEMGINVVDVKNLTGGSALSSSRMGAPFTVSGVGTPGCANGECNDCGQCVDERKDTVNAIVTSGASRISAKPGISHFDRKLARYIDHTLLKPDATADQIRKLCEEAKYYEFASVCVNPTNVSLAAEYLRDNPNVKVCTVIGFPLGATTPTVKALETRDAIANGAQEIDMVINVGALKSGNDELVRKDIEAVVNAAKGAGAIVKVILETALLKPEEIVKGSLLAKLAGADFVKTSTGFSSGGATVEDVALMRKTVGPDMGVKASGGVRTQEDAEKMIEAGATRIGASASVAIVQGGAVSTGSY